MEESVKRNILSGKSANLEKSLKKKTSLLGCSPYNLLCTSPSSSSHQKQTKLKGKSYSLLIFLCTSPSSRVRYNIPPPSSFFYTFLLLLPVSVFVCVSLKTALLKGFFTQGAPLLTLKEEEKKRKATKKTCYILRFTFLHKIYTSVCSLFNLLSTCMHKTHPKKYC